jgi:mannose-1-phosphate guanylyltransferase
MNNKYCVIMAGGIGSRFWPMSRHSHPKQFIDVLGIGRTLLQHTYDRFLKLCPKENIFVVTNDVYIPLVQEQLPELERNQILGEPVRRNTAPCVAYASYKIRNINPNANIVVAPSDHIILKEDAFLEAIERSMKFTSTHDALVTLGIHPSRPDTGYGYIQLDEQQFDLQHKVYKVKTFTEKPNLDMARFFLQSGEFLWNSGIFVWNVSSIIASFEKLLPEVSNLFLEGEKMYNTSQETEFIRKVYSQCTNISIDYGVMEKAENVYVLPSEFGWSDLGTWGSLYEHSRKDENSNAVVGSNVMLYDSKNCVINMPKDKLVVLQGLDNYIIAESDGILLICRKEDEQEIKQFVNDVKISKGERFV